MTAMTGEKTKVMAYSVEKAGKSEDEGERIRYHVPVLTELVSNLYISVI
jgi:hypothetical protein